MSTSHEPSYAEDGKPGLRYQLYHEEKAKGGLALTMFGGSTNIAPDSPPVFGQLYAGNDEIIPYFQALADRVHAHGAYTMVQLTHMGRRTVWDAGDWLPTIAPSSIREPAHRTFPKEMEEADIRRVVRAFGQAAKRAQLGGLDGVELIAYGHMIDQFWSPLTNQRTDRYGGSFENRVRFALEVFEEVRNQVGDDFIVGVRMAASEEKTGGIAPDDGVAIIKMLTDAGMVDFVNVIRGYIATDRDLAQVIPISGTPLGPHLAFAGAIKAQIDVPVFQAARVADLATARHAIDNGLVDMVGMTRAHMADPHIVNKLMRGDEARIRPCVGMSYCLNRIYLGHGAACAHNPATGREETIPQVVPRSEGPTKRVVVIGGGVAGLEAARVAAERGHTVTLFEAAHELGGQVLLAARALERRIELLGIVEWLIAEIGHAGVEVRLNTLAEAESVLALEPDVVIVATGGWPRTEILEEGSSLVDSTWDVISGNVKTHTNVLIYDDDGTDAALSVAERLARQGSSVELVTPDRIAGHEVYGTTFVGYLEAFYELGVRMTPDERVVAVHRNGAELVATLENEFTGRRQERRVDQVIVQHGTEPIASLYFELIAGSSNGGELDIDSFIEIEPQSHVTNESGSYQLFRIGDAVQSRNIHAAIYEARRLCLPL